MIPTICKKKETKLKRNEPNKQQIFQNYLPPDEQPTMWQAPLQSTCFNG